MNQIRWITPNFAVSDQIDSNGVAEAAAAGVKIILNNRPDGEALGQPRSEEIGKAAAANGLQYRSLPFVGPPPPAIVEAVAGLLREAPGPILAFCRSGRRSITAWAMAEALGGGRAADELITLSKKAGYDLEGMRAALDSLSPRP